MLERRLSRPICVAVEFYRMGGRESLGTTLATLVETEGLVLHRVQRSFVFDILIAWSCREAGATLVSRNLADLNRIATVFAFDFVVPYPSHHQN